jgi:transposase-like protein
MLSKIIIEAALNAELDANLGYDKNQITGSDNSRNGFTSKTMQTEDGQFEIDMPRDRNGDFEPKLVKKKSATYAFCGRQGHAFLYTRIIHARHRRHV